MTSVFARSEIMLPDQDAVNTHAATVYAARQGTSEQAFLERMGPPLTPELVDCRVVALLTDKVYQDGIAFGIISQMKGIAPPKEMGDRHRGVKAPCHVKKSPNDG